MVLLGNLIKGMGKSSILYITHIFLLLFFLMFFFNRYLGSFFYLVFHRSLVVYVYSVYY